MTIRIRGTDRPTFAVYTLDGPSRVVVDISGAALDERITTAGGVMASWTLSEWAVSQISAYSLQSQESNASGRDGGRNGSGLVRIVVELARPGTYHAKAEGRDVVVTVMPREPAPPRASPEEAAKAAAAVREAEARRRELISAIEEAERRREQAEAQRAQAEQKRAAVESELREAEKKRASAEAAATEAARRAEQARALREKEEAAHREASQARKEAERRNAEASQAGERLAALQATAKKAQAELETLRQAAAEAARRAAGIEEQKNATERDIARARREAERLEKARADAEAELNRQRSGIARQEREAKRLAEARSKAEADLRALDASAAEARKARQEEEARIAELSKQRQELEREVERIRAQTRATARAERASQQKQTEAERKRAEAARKQAEAELRALDASAAEARKARQEEQQRMAELSKRRQALEAQLEQMRAQAEQKARTERKAQHTQAKTEQKQSEAEAQRAEAARKRAEAELRALDTSAAEARKARQEEEQRMAELSKRRQALDAQLEQMRVQAQQRARVEREAQQRARAEREAQHKEAEAELRALDASAAEARKARQEEEARIAELSKRRQALEAQLEQMRAQTTAAAEASRGSTDSAPAAGKTADTSADTLADASKGTKSASGKVQARVKDVDFEDHSQIARVIVALSANVEPRIVSSKGKRVILEINGAELPEKLQRTLDTRPYRGPIQAISSYRHPKDRSRMRVVVDLAYPAKNTLRRKGSTYYWDFAKPAAQPSEALASDAPNGSSRSKTRAQSYPAPVVGGYGASSTPITRKTVAQLANRDRKVYRGTKIDLDLKDVDIHNVMRLLADVGGINIVIPDDVSAQVTVRLRQVPWDQALEVVLASKGLWYRREGNLYRIAPRKQLDAEDQAEAERIANLVKAEAPEPQVFTLNYSVAKDIKSQLEPLLSPKGRIEVDERTNSLIINDIRAHRRRIIDLLTRLDTQTPQIQIEARIVEAGSTFTRDIGVQWGGRSSSNTGLVFPNFIDVAGGNVDQQTQFDGVYTPAASPDFAVNLPAAVGTGAGGAVGIFLRSLGGDALTLRLSALENTGSVRIISAPKITVLNNVEAEISQGVSIPISVISANGVQTQFVPADLSLKVTPHVSQRDCSIAMDLEVSKNEADFTNTGARGDPTITRKEARTTVLVADNETTVIGGIYTRNSGLSYSKVPFFGDLPILGWLFKNRVENDTRSEVLVFITPRITNKAFLRCE